MDSIIISPVEWWFLWAFVGLLVELLLAPGFGVLFISFGALTVAGLMLVFPSLEIYQYLFFCLFSFAWVAILWKPIKCYVFSAKKNHTSSSDLVGQEVEVINNPLTSVVGQVKWSGTIMNARLNDDSHDTASVGSVLKITGIEGNTLICEYPKNNTNLI